MRNVDRFKIPFYETGAITITTTGKLWTSTTFSQGEHWDMSVEAISGDIWLSCLTSAVTTTGGFKLLEGDCIDLKVPREISFVSTAATPVLQAIIWEK
jgi:hypothetical protein